MMHYSFKSPVDIKRATERVLGEREDRLKAASQMLKIGVPFLDSATGGIFPDDLFLVGAASGAGKTEFLCQLAKVNVEMGKRVHFFALEAKKREIERRILYRLISQSFFKDPHHPYIPISYRDWMRGELDELVIPYETEAQRIFDQKYHNLFTIYRQGDFGLHELETHLDAIEKKTDLIIIDHLNYFDYDEKMSENQAVTKIVKRIKDLTELNQIPIVLAAHIRKKDRFDKSIMPGLEDFFGSSNIYKVATQAVLLSPGDQGASTSPIRWPTYIRVAKDRIEGSLKRFVARCTFNSEKNEYEPDYSLSFFKEGQTEFTPIQDKASLPRWAKA